MSLLAHQARLMGGEVGPAGSVFDPTLKHADITLSSSNAVALGGAGDGYRSVFGTQGRSSGIYAFDIVVLELPSPSAILAGFADKTNPEPILSTFIGNNSGQVEAIGYNDNNLVSTSGGSGRIYRRMTVGNTNGAITDRYAAGDRITIQANMGTNQAQFYKNGTAVSSVFNITSGKTYFPAVSLQKSAKVQIVTVGLPFLPTGASEWG